MNSRIEIGGDGNTVSLMECLRDNPKDYISEPIYYHNELRWIVSRLPKEKVNSCLLAYPIDTWFEYRGMRRLNTGYKWFVFFIDGEYYFAS